MKTVFAVVALVSTFVASASAADSLNVYFGNLHSHTSYSDGSGTPDIAYEHARNVAGLDFLAITEHNHLSARSKIARNPALYNGAGPDSMKSISARFTQNGRFVALYGQEFSTIDPGNHANVFEPNAVISERDVESGDWKTLFNTWLPAHPDTDGNPAIMLFNHPNASDSRNEKEYGINQFGGLAGWLAKVEPHVRMINIVNGPSHQGNKPGKPSENEFLRYLNLGLRVAPTADQDNHKMNWGSAAETRTAIIAPALTRQALFAGMRARNVYATEDRNLRIIAKINGELIGKRFQGASVPANGSELTIEVQIVDDDEPDARYKIVAYKDTVGGEEADVASLPLTANGNGLHRVMGVRYTGGEEYVFLKITQSDDDGEEVDTAWLAPVWFEPNAPSAGTVVAASGPNLTLTVDLIGETAVVGNIGNQAINLNGWKLISVEGNQTFPFGNVSLQPGQSVTVTSGPHARNEPPNFLKWTTGPIWRNTGDVGKLVDQAGAVRAQTRD